MNNRTTTTVAVRLDLAELITQLRNLADTLETTHKPKTDPQGLPPEYDGETFAPEDIECTHEAWDVHPNGITRHCSDLPRTPARPRRGPPSKLSDAALRRKKALAALRRKLSGQPEPSHFTDGTKPARNPHTLDLPDGMDPAEAEHILRVTDAALKARTQPIMFFADGTLSSHGLVATLNQPAPDLGVDSHGLRCTRCEHPYHRRSICPACGCDPRRADHGADPR